VGEGARTISDEWEREVERPGLNEAHLIGCGMPQNCGSSESKMGADQSTTTEEGSVGANYDKARQSKTGGPCRLKDILLR
jgi:hypothetical protein